MYYCNCKVIISFKFCSKKTPHLRARPHDTAKKQQKKNEAARDKNS